MDQLKAESPLPSVRGRSVLFNVLSIAVNIVGVVIVVSAFHESSEGNSPWLKLTGIGLIGISLAALFVLKGVYLFSYVARAFVGGLFVVSGLVKANDPWGFALKLEEYLSPNGLSADFPFFEYFAPYSLQLSILVCVVEIVLGVAVVLGGKLKWASWALLLMMVFFTWLTWYTANCSVKQEMALQSGIAFDRDCVTDCGCFGDALKGSVGRSLTPWESFWKDVVLGYFVLIIFINQGAIKLNTRRENSMMIPASMLVVAFFSWVFGWLFPIFFTLFILFGGLLFSRVSLGKMANDWKIALFVTAVAFLFSSYTASYLPIKDYRPYRVGSSIPEQMSNGVAQVSEFVLVYENLTTGEQETFALSDYETYGDTNQYRYVDRKETVLVPGMDASINDFSASIDYALLGRREKEIPYVDSLINADYALYYEEKRTVTSAYGVDTIAAADYDVLSYPDSIYTASAPFFALSDPTTPWVIDMTPLLLSEETVLLMTVKDIAEVNERAMPDLKAIYEGAQQHGLPFYVLSAATTEQIEAFREKYDFDATFLSFDGTELKIIIRSNPGLVLLNKGVVKEKWASRSIPDAATIFEKYTATR